MAVTRELLVRHLDAWTPAVLHGHRRATYCEAFADVASAAGDAPAEAAVRVFGEFTDLLADHELTMVLAGSDRRRLAAALRRLRSVAIEIGCSSGLALHPVDGVPGLVAELVAAGAHGCPVFLFFDEYAHTAGRPEPGPSRPAAHTRATRVGPQEWFDVVAEVAAFRDSELLLAVSSSTLDCPAWSVGSLVGMLGSSGLRFLCLAELVDTHGDVELLVFATASAKRLEMFKGELWALDEYAGIRYRDPNDPEHTLLDISLDPPLGPLKRSLQRHLLDHGPSTVAQLREYALRQTLYRPADATRAVQALVAGGTARRTPTGGRLAPGTEIAAA
jgi:hypothetical protein